MINYLLIAARALSKMERVFGEETRLEKEVVILIQGRLGCFFKGKNKMFTFIAK